MVVRKIGREEVYLGLVSSTSEYRTPGEALAWLQGRSGGVNASTPHAPRRPPAGPKATPRARRAGLR